MKWKTRFAFLCAVISLMFVLAACSEDKTESESAKVSKDSEQATTDQPLKPLIRKLRKRQKRS